MVSSVVSFRGAGFSNHRSFLVFPPCSLASKACERRVHSVKLEKGNLATTRPYIGVYCFSTTLGQKYIYIYIYVYIYIYKYVYMCLCVVVLRVPFVTCRLKGQPKGQPSVLRSRYFATHTPLLNPAARAQASTACISLVCIFCLLNQVISPAASMEADRKVLEDLRFF